MQRHPAAGAQRFLETVAGPRTTVTASFAWKKARRGGRIDPAELDRLRALGHERCRQQQARKAKRTAMR
jgi:hypothetical protein